MVPVLGFVISPDYLLEGGCRPVGWLVEGSLQ